MKRLLSSMPIAAAVLAGGEARRMNGNKAGALLAGRPLISYPIAALRAAGLEPFVVTKTDRPVGLIPGFDQGEAKVIIESDRPRHPLVGVRAALLHAEGRPVIVVGCDLPFLPAGFLRRLSEPSSRTIVARVDGHLQPLAARYGSDAIPAVTHGIETSAPVTRVITELNPLILEEEELREFGDPARMFRNLNTPDDLAAAERLSPQADN